MKTLEQQILSCMTVRLTEQFPALAPAFSLLSFQESENMGTDGSCFYYEKTALRNAFLENRLDFLFLHSLTHMLFLHFLPEASVEQEVWNLAADLAASYFVDTYLLTESPEATERQKIYVKLPPGARSAEKFYSFLARLPAEERQGFLACQADDHSRWFSKGDDVFGSFTGAGGTEASDLFPGTPSDSGNSSGSSGTSSPDFPQKTASSARTEQIQRIQKTLELLSLSALTPSPRKKSRRGAAPGSRLEWLLLEKRGSYDFRRYLKRFTITREETKADLDSFDYIPYCYGLSRPEKLLFLEPLEYRDSMKIQDLVIAIDTSGSCSLETVSRFLSETLVILSSSENFFKKMNVHLIQCDSAIQSHTVIHSAEEWVENSRKIRILGRGGTDFTPVFSYVKELLEKKELTHLKGLLYFTDGDGIYPTSPPPYETAFVFTDFSFLNYPVPAFITKLCLETNQAGNEVFQYEH